MEEKALRTERHQKIRLRRKSCVLRIIPNYTAFTDNYGASDDDCRKPEILIDADLVGVKLLDTVLHEFMHVCLPDLKESAVDQSATSIAKALVLLFPNLKELAI